MIDKVAIVTGSNKGLGFEIVKELCAKDVRVVYLTSRDEERGKEACKMLQSCGLKPVFHQLDVTNENSVIKMYKHIQEIHEKFDILVNNAGILFLNDSTASKLYQAEQTMLVNFFSLVNFTEKMLPLLKDGGTILNISSSSGHLSRIPSTELKQRISSQNITLNELTDLMHEYLEAVKSGKEVEAGWGNSPYVVSKVGVNAYTFLLNRRLAPRGIKVNCVHPGYVMSDMTRGGGTVSAADAAKLPLKLALEPASGSQYVWSNGEIVPWDGSDPRGYIDGKNV